MLQEDRLVVQELLWKLTNRNLESGNTTAAIMLKGHRYSAVWNGYMMKKEMPMQAVFCFDRRRPYGGYIASIDPEVHCTWEYHLQQLLERLLPNL